MVKVNVLECSSKGDKRFSAFYAKVVAFNTLDSIENHYQCSKRSYDGGHVRKGSPVDHMMLNGIKLDVRFLTQWYNLLWIKYLDNNPKLVDVLGQYEDYTDKFKGKAINCQADVIRAYMQNRIALLKSCKELLDILKADCRRD